LLISVFEKGTNLFNATGHHDAAPPLPKSPLISSYQQQKHLAKDYRSLLHKMISIYFYCWWVEDVSFQSPLVGPCLHTHTEL